MNRVTVLRKVFHSLLDYRLGMLVIGAVMGVRLLGLFQFLELAALDRLQKVGLPEPEDAYITILGIDSQYLDALGADKLSRRQLADLLEKVMIHDPAIVGMDIIEDDLGTLDNSLLQNVFEKYDNLITVEKVLPPKISPLSEVSDKTSEFEKIGFNDISLDDDANVRRMLLGVNPDRQSPFKKSFPLLIVEKYLSKIHGIEIENGIHDRDAMRFSDTEIPKLYQDSGGYHSEEEIYGVQTLINFRKGGKEAFNILKLSDSTAEFQAHDIKNKVILIGFIDFDLVPVFDTPVSSQLRDVFGGDVRLTGIELQAHSISQLISAVIDDRPLIFSLPEVLEYWLILVFGLVGMSLRVLSQAKFKKKFFNFVPLTVSTLLITIFSLSILFIYASFVIFGLWLPAVPCFLVLLINGVTYAGISQSDKSWRTLIEERDGALISLQTTIEERDRVLSSLQTMIEERDHAFSSLKTERRKTIERVFDAIHNGPLQSLANLLRRVRDHDVMPTDIGAELNTLNRDIRDIGESLKQASISDEEDLYVTVGKTRLDLNTPINELFYEIYRETLTRPFPGFRDLKIQSRSFEPIEDEIFTKDCKRKLCRFIEEMLCNVGRHAVGATQLTVVGKVINSSYKLTVIDNGPGIFSNHISQGTGSKIAYELAAQLNGTFEQKNNTPKGVFCAMSWQIK